MEKFKSEVSIPGNDAIFYIKNDNLNAETSLYTYGRNGVGALEVYVSDIGDFLQSITCVYSNNIIEMDMHFQEPEEMGLEQVGYAQIEMPENPSASGDFQVTFDKDEMDIIFSKLTGMAKYYKNDRVEYYLNNDDELLYVRIRNLSEDEYLYLQSQKKKTQSTVRNSIQDLLNNIKNKENINIIHAAIIGSKGWEYEDNNSDLDLRFVYTRNPEDYLSISAPNDSISYPIENKEDILGYDLAKFLMLICKQNPVAYEMIHSNKQLGDDGLTNELLSFSDKIFNPAKIISIYKHMIEARIAELEKSNVGDLKLVLYILRMIGTVNYIHETSKHPVCTIDEVFKIDSNKVIKDLIYSLIEQKKQGIKSINVDPALLELLKQQLNNINNSQNMINNISFDDAQKEANGIFYKVVLSSKRNQELIEMKEEMNKEKEEETIIRK